MTVRIVGAGMLSIGCEANVDEVVRVCGVDAQGEAVAAARGEGKVEKFRWLTPIAVVESRRKLIIEDPPQSFLGPREETALDGVLHARRQDLHVLMNIFGRSRGSRGLRRRIIQRYPCQAPQC